MPYLHLGRAASPDDPTLFSDDGSVDYGDGFSEPAPIEFAAPPTIEVHTLPVDDATGAVQLPDIIVNASRPGVPPLLLLAAVALGIYALSKGGGGSHKGWD